jgi:hypothetical protein
VKALGRIEALLDEPGLAQAIAHLEATLPLGVRPRQLAVRTLLVGLLGCLAEGRQNAYLSDVHAVLVGLEEADQERLGVRVEWKGGPHALTYRQVEYTTHVLERALSKDTPDGAPSQGLQAFCDQLLEASIPALYKDATGAYAIDWTDVESFSRPPSEADGPCADPEAHFGHRRGDGPGQKDELFFGYYESLMVMVPERAGERVPELIRRAQLVSCRLDPVPGFVGVVTTSAASGVVVAEVLADCGYSYKVPEHFAFPLRAAGVHLVIDLHPNDRGQKGTFAGGIVANGNVYCPGTPAALLSLSPLARGASAEDTSAHDERCAELARYKLGRICSDDADGFHRVSCPAVLGKVRCALRPSSVALPNSRPEVFAVPEHPPTCCTQQSVTVLPEVNAKTRQRHDYPSAAHRVSYGRRSGAERANSRLKDPAGINVDQLGWCKLMGLVPLSLFLACACVVVNFDLIDAFEAHQSDAARRAATPVPRPRARRRKTLADLARAPAPP